MSLLIPGLCGQSVFLTVPHFHRPEETLHATGLFTEPGGKGYNQAVSARRMGAEVTFAGAIGQDADGEVCIKRLQEEEIHQQMFVKPERTAYAAILTDAAGENRVTVFSGARLSAADMEQMEEQFIRARMLLLTPEIPEEAFSKAIELAQKHEVRIVINPAPYFPWVDRYLKDAWLVTPNRSEACGMLGCSSENLMEQLEKAPFERMAVTLGSDGAACIENGKITLVPAVPAKAVDTTGAGDCFNGALCALLLEGFSLKEAIQKAVCAASLSVRHAHVLDGLPYRKDLD